MALEQHLEVLSAVASLWPSHAGTEAKVKHAAAIYLLQKRQLTEKCALVGGHVTNTVGRIKDLGLTKGFEQLLDCDPCFIVDRSLPNARVTLNTSQVLLQHQWRLEEQPQQHRQQPGRQLSDRHSAATAVPGTAQGAVHIRATPKLLQGLNQHWPLQGSRATPDSIIKHKALYHLIGEPLHSCLRSALALAVKKALGKSAKDVGCTKPFGQLLQEEPHIFVLGPGRGPSEASVTLNVQGVLDTFVRKRQQTSPQATQQQHSAALAGPSVLPLQQQQSTSAPAPAPAPDVAAEPSLGSAAHLLQYVRSRQWHLNPVLDAARRALAERLVLKANPAMDQPVNRDTKRYTMLGALAGFISAKTLEHLGPSDAALTPSLEQVVDQDPYLSIYRVGDVQHIRMDALQLLQDADASEQASTTLQQQHPAAAPNASSSTVNAASAATVLDDHALDGQAAPADTQPSVEISNAAAAGTSVPGAENSAQGQAQQVSAAALLEHVEQRCWHKSNPQLHLARRTVAVNLVQQVHPDGIDHRPANSTAEAYTQTFATAGNVAIQALRAHFGSNMQPCYKKVAEIFQDDPCWHTFRCAPTQYSVQLKVQHLLQEMAAAQQGPMYTASSSSGRSPGSTQGIVEAVRTGAAASASTVGSKKQGAVAASPAAAAAAVGSSGSAAAEVAAAAIRAAAKSLMPPPVRSPAATPAGAAAADPAGTMAAAAATAVSGLPGGSSTLPSTAGGDGGGLMLLAGSPAAELLQPQAQSEPFLPPWLQLCRARAVPAAQQPTTSTQQQQQQQAEGKTVEQPGLISGQAAQADLQQAIQQQELSVSTSGPGQVLSPSSAAPARGVPQQQMQGSNGLQALGVAAADTPQAVSAPLQYELQLQVTAPGWYVAKYVAYDPAPGSPTIAASPAANAAATPGGAAGRASICASEASDSFASSVARETMIGAALAAAVGAGAGEATEVAVGADRADVSSDAAGKEALGGVATAPQTSPADSEGSSEGDLTSAGSTTTPLDSQVIIAAIKGVTDRIEAALGCIADPVAAESTEQQDVAGSTKKPEAAAAADSPAALNAVGAAAAAVTESSNAAAEQCMSGLDMLNLLQALPDKCHSELLPHLSSRPGPTGPRLTRIVISRAQPVTLRFSNRTARTLTTHVTLTEALQQLLAAQQEWMSVRQQQQGQQQGQQQDSRSGIEGVCGNGSSCSPVNGDVSSQHDQHGDHNNHGSKAALAAAQPAEHTALQAAAVKLFSGNSSSSSSRCWCIGVPFSCHRVCAVCDAAGDISGLTYCIDTQHQGAAQGLADVLTTMKASLWVGQEEEATGAIDRPRSLLLLGRPGVGKAGLLRDMCRLMSSPPGAGGLGLDVMLIDTPGHVAGIAAEPCVDIGSTRCLSAPTASAQQHQLMLHAALQHQPDVLVVNELSTQQDVAAAVHIARSRNVLLVAAAPAAASLEELLADVTLCQLVGCERVVTGVATSAPMGACKAANSSGAAANSSNYNCQVPIQRWQQSPFAVILEVTGRDRWRLHLDVPSCVAAMLSEHLADAIGSRDHQQPVGTSSHALQLHTQMRTRDAAGRTMVQFTSPAAACRALEAADLLRDMVCNLAERADS